MSPLEKKLEQLRLDWVKYPERRPFIEKMAVSVKKWKEYYENKSAKKIEVVDENYEFAKKLFGTENATPLTQTS